MNYQLILFIFAVFVVSGCDNSASINNKPNITEQQKQSDGCLQSSTSNDDSILEPRITQVCPIS